MADFRLNVFSSKSILLSYYHLNDIYYIYLYYLSYLFCIILYYYILSFKLYILYIYIYCLYCIILLYYYIYYHLNQNRCTSTRNEEMNENCQLQLSCRYILTRCTCEIRSSVNYTVEEPKRRQQVIAPDAMPSFDYTLQTMLLPLSSFSARLLPLSYLSSFSLSLSRGTRRRYTAGQTLVEFQPRRIDFFSIGSFLS